MSIKSKVVGTSVQGDFVRMDILVFCLIRLMV